VDSTPKNFVRALRRNQTEAEKRLWRKLRSREFQGVKFRRQQPLGPYVADFCSFQNKVIIELDGGQHALTNEKDAKRTAYLKQSGFQVIRFWDNEVLNNIEGVLEDIWQNLNQPPLTPALFRKGRGGKEKT
jgi:very-short-patch-repair endonuclease